MVDTRIRIEEYVLFWRAETYGLFCVFQQQEYDISLELQNVAIRDGDYVGIELNIELCHNSVTIDQLESEYNYYDHMLLYLSNSQCSRNYGEVVLSNSHFRRISGVHKQGGFSVSASSFIQFVNLTFSSVVSPLNIHNVPNMNLQNINITNCFGVVVTHQNSSITYTGSNFIWDNSRAQYGVLFLWNSNVIFQGHTRVFL